MSRLFATSVPLSHAATARSRLRLHTPISKTVIAALPSLSKTQRGVLPRRKKDSRAKRAQERAMLRPGRKKVAADPWVWRVRAMFRQGRRKVAADPWVWRGQAMLRQGRRKVAAGEQRKLPR